jgi:hypothetical protein
MKKRIAVLLPLFVLLVCCPTFALGAPPDLNGVSWQGEVTYQADSGGPQTITVVFTITSQGGPNNNFIAGTIAAPALTSSVRPRLAAAAVEVLPGLPDGFPTTFSGVIGPFNNCLLHLTAADTVMSADVFGRGRHRLAVLGHIVGGSLAGTTFQGFLARQ